MTEARRAFAVNTGREYQMILKGSLSLLCGATKAMSSISAFLVLLLCVCGTALSMEVTLPAETKPAQQSPAVVPFDADRWNFAEDVRIIPFDGRTTLTGTAYLKGVSFLNGTIETDMWITGETNFAGFTFRVHSFDELEWFWLRLSKTNGLISDAVQYAPAYHGVFCWQLHPEAIGPANVPKNQWVHLKLEILNSSAALYIGDMTKPVKTVDRLRLGLIPGSVGLKTYGKGGVYFSNFSYRIDESSKPDLRSPEVVPPNIVANWQLSPSYPLQKVDAIPTVYPTDRLAEIRNWIRPDVDVSGLVNITKYHGTPYHGRAVATGGKPDYTILRAVIEADQDKRVKMNFGYSDAATIFLNQVPLFSGNSAFVSRNIAYGGWISFNDAVFLDLKKGRNELLVIVAEDFGGWGFQAKLETTDGLNFIHAPAENPAGE